MQKGNAAELAVAVLEILDRYSDENHLISMPNLQAVLSEDGIETNRQTVYKAIDILKKHGFDISFRKAKGLQGYFLKHAFTKAEAFVLVSAVQEAMALTKEETESLVARITSHISEYAAKELPQIVPAAGKAKDAGILKNIEILLEAIPKHHPVEFKYFDYTVSRTKQYRKDGRSYHLIPYGIASDQGRYYCIFYNEKYGSFGNYRIDKMERIKVLEECADPVMFSLENHIRSSFHMYTSEATTISVRFDKSLSSVVYDQFGMNDIIISKTTNETFTANIKTAITPTLVSWLLQFPDQCTVERPASLINELKRIAASINARYQ